MSESLRLPIGIHTDIAAADYHADPCEEPSLSSSLAKIILRQTPRHAWQEHPRLNPELEQTDDGKFDLGSVAHEIILGKGGGFDVLDFDSWSTKDAKKARAASREIGRTPILKDQHESALAMSKAINERLLEIPECRDIFDEDARGFVNGNAETVLIWRDIGGPLCRAMIDWWGPTELEVWDLKTTAAGLSDSALKRTIINLGYDLSAGFYRRGLHALRPGLLGRLKWRWIFVEAAAPFECRVIEADAMTLEIGDRKAALAITKWHKCTEANEWPGYPARVDRLEYPEWAYGQWIDHEAGDDDANSMVVSTASIERPVKRIYGAV